MNERTDEDWMKRKRQERGDITPLSHSCQRGWTVLVLVLVLCWL